MTCHSSRIPIIFFAVKKKTDVLHINSYTGVPVAAVSIVIKSIICNMSNTKEFFAVIVVSI